MDFRAHVRHLLHLTLVIGLALFSAGVLAQDPPGRVGRLVHAEGTVTFAPGGDDEWMDAPRNRPLTRGDRLWTDRGSRAEIQVGSATIRLDGLSRLEILQLDDHSTKLSLTQGTANVRVRNLPEGENFELDTPNLAHRAAYPGDYRVDVDAQLGTTRVTIHSGAGTVYGEAGQAQSLGGGQQVTFRGRALVQLEARESPAQDAFDRWASERNRREDQSIAARYVPREVVGYQELDPHGQWTRDAIHGAVWIPHGMPADWAPYRHGRWEWISPWGWTWIDDAPWGFAPFHYGRWTLLAGRWAWVPGRLSQRPVYAPALVAFVGGGRGILPGVSASEIAWFPLAPGEMWQPGFRASMAYISNVNRHMLPGQDDASYVFQRRREALTAISREDFHRGRPVAAGWLRVAAIRLTNASVVPPPPLPERALASREPKPVARSAPPPAPPVQQVTAITPAPVAQPAHAPAAAGRSSEQNQAAAAKPPAAVAAAGEQVPAPARPRAGQPAGAERARDAQAAAAAQARAQASAAASARQAAAARAEALRREQQQQARRAEAQQREQALGQPARLRREQAQRAEPARRQQAARTEQLKREPATARAEQAKRKQLAQREQPTRGEQQARQAQAARREALARREGQLRREAVAHREEQLQREAVARRDEQLRREARATQVEQARRAADQEAQALRQQRMQRDEQARRAAQEREQAQREAWQREQQAIADQVRRAQSLEQQQRQRARPRPDLRPDWRPDGRDRPAEVWQRGVPVLNPGRTSESPTSGRQRFA
jgi:hypothetical protein